MISYISWNLGAFVAAFLANSFVEWSVHRFIMHRKIWWIPYGYNHVTSHHTAFGYRWTYHAIDRQMMDHGVSFTWREYVLFPLLCTLIYLPLTWAIGKPVFPGCLLSVVAGLLLFDFMHYGYHVPNDGWFQKTKFFRFMKEHHRLHHKDMTKNFNVNFLPIADFLLGTLRR